MNRRLLFLFCLLASFSFFEARASHIVGGEFTYKFIQDSVVGGITLNEYQVSLSIYEDCLNGNPDAINQDNPAYLGLFNAISGNELGLDTNVNYTTSETVPVNFSNSCVSNIPATCLLKKTFNKIYLLPPSSAGYIVAYQRCCRNAAIVNINAPGDNGSTYYCYIPPTTLVSNNNSAVFKNFPPQVICLNNPLFYDNSATDADGDSLSYGFAPALNGADDPNNSKPYPSGPPYGDATYVAPYTALYPVSSYPALHIDPVTGLITGTPNALGRYLVTVYCNEYRHGVLINTIKREFQFVVTPCTKVVVANIPQYSTDFNTYLVVCSGYTVNFVNSSTGGFAYHWDFGVPGTSEDTSSDFEPSFTYPDTGTYLVRLIVNRQSTCPDSISRYVKVYPYFHANYSDTGSQCQGTPISFTDLSSATLKPITNWYWNFGDGDTSSVQNPVHIYTYSGTFNVVLISQNIRNCVDTVVKQVLVDNFKPFAGNDTIVVKGSSVQFNAVGGISYAWTPGTNLSDTAINNPVGYYPDTGTFTYYLYVTSELGCKGYDTIKVMVVNQAEFFVPDAFTPNGDGKNDVFRPVAVGYRSFNYFKVFDRYGQMVYNSNVLDGGWDGTFKSEKMDMGTYFWEMSFTDRYGKQSFLKGDVILIR